MPFLESCNVNDSTKYGLSTTARALSSPRPSGLGRVLNRGHSYRTTCRRDEIMKLHTYECVVSVSYQVNMSNQEWQFQFYWFKSYLPLVKIYFKVKLISINFVLCIHETLKIYLSKYDEFNFIVSLFYFSLFYQTPFKSHGPDYNPNTDFEDMFWIYCSVLQIKQHFLANTR